MPASTIANFFLTNAGPLTTTFTAPKSCATAAGWSAYAETKSDLGGAFPRWKFDCDNGFSYGNCFPDGEKKDEIGESLGNKPEPTYLEFHYHSPGLHCPSGWTTVGAAEKSSDGKISLSGLPYKDHGTATIAPELDTDPTPERYFAYALDKGETAALCCPIGYTAGIEGIQCWSEIETSESLAKTVCDLYGESTMTGTGDGFLFPHTTLSPEAIKEKELAAYRYMPMVTLVHTSGDKEGSGDDNSQSDDNSRSHGDDEDVGAWNWGGANILMTGLGAAAIVGAFLIL